MNTLYIVPSYECNLRCSHCNVRKLGMTRDFEKFVDTFKSLDYQAGVLFGGEPLLMSRDDLNTLFAANHIDSVSTNLSFDIGDKIDILCENRVCVSTSWNPTRFTYDQYGVWLGNLRMLDKLGIRTLVMITLTHDLFTSDVNGVMSDIDRLELNNFDGVLFEPLLPSDREHVEKCDDWLCRISDSWRYSYNNVIAERYTAGNTHSCSETYTINPDGSVARYCPGCE